MLTLNAGSSGTGPALATGSATQTIVRGTNNAVAIALGGIVASTAVSLASPNPAMGAASSTAVTVAAYDASGEQITGATPYAAPLALADSDTTGATSLSTTTLAGPNDAAPVLTYNGSGFVNASITAVVSGVTNFRSTPGTLMPYLRATEYAIPSHQTAGNAYGGGGDMVVGADGALWFIEQRAIGRVTTSGAITEYPAAAPQAIAAGPDGALWFTQGSGGIGRLTTAGASSSFAAGGTSGAAIATGSDGNLWFISTNPYPPAVVKMTTAGATTQVPLPAPSSAPLISPTALVAAPDGNLWTADYYGRLVRIATGGTVTVFPIPTSSGLLQPSSLTAASDGALWVAGSGGLARFANDGTLTASYRTSLGTIYQYGFVQAPDGSFWFTGNAYGTPAASVVRFDPAGQFALFLIPNSATPPGASYPTPVTAFVAGPDGNLWYSRGAAVGRIALH